MRRISMPYVISAAYFIAGIALIIVAAQSKYIPLHACLVGVLNIIASCGVHVKDKWAFPALISISLISLVFGLTMLVTIVLAPGHNALSALALLGTIFYIILSIMSLVYATVRKG